MTNQPSLIRKFAGLIAAVLSLFALAASAAPALAAVAPPTLPVTKGLQPSQLQEQPRCSGELATIIGTEGDDRLLGTRNRDVIVGLGGDDRIAGLTGDDIVCGGDGDDIITGGSGDDEIFGQGGDDIVLGHGGDDGLHGGAGDDQVDGGTGNDHLTTSIGDDHAIGGAGSDVMLLGPGADTADGEEGHDEIVGGEGDDELVGGAGNDQLRGGEGDDQLLGGTGRDQLDGDEGDDRIAGGTGLDACDIAYDEVRDCESLPEDPDPFPSDADAALGDDPLSDSAPDGLDSAPPVSASVAAAPIGGVGRSGYQNLTAAGLEAMIQCESGSHGRHATNTGNGFFGAVQWILPTWDAATAGAGYPEYVGVRPDLVPAGVQDAVTYYWWSVSNPSTQWPVCHRRALAAM